MPSTFQDVEAIVRDTYLIADPGIVRILVASVIANRLPTKPVWLFIVAGSSTGKTELLKMLSGLPDIHSLDTLTPNTLLSGSLGNDSLIFKLYSKIVTFADFTTILSMNDMARDEIMGQLRCVYDGKLTKATGNRKETLEWAGKMGMLAAVTTAIYAHAAKYAEMGQRFLMYKFVTADRKEIGRKALKNESRWDMNIRSVEIADVVSEYVNGLTLPGELPTLPDAISNQIVDIVDITTLARSAVPRDQYSRTKIITSREDPEGIPRMSAQLYALGCAFAVMNGSTNLPDSDKAILFKCALDTIPALRRMALFALTEYSSVQVQGLSTHCRLPPDTMQYVLEDLAALDLIDRIKEPQKAERWRLKPEYKRVLAQFAGIVPSMDDLTGEAERDAREPPPPTDKDLPPNIMDL